MENIYEGYRLARKGKTWQIAVQRVMRDEARYLAHLQELFLSGRIRTSPYRIKVLYEPKRREAHVLPFFPDRIAHHAVMNIVIPLWEPMFYKDVYGCIPGKGQHAASTRCMQFVKRNLYCGQLDVRKFFYSIDHDICMSIVEHKIKCKPTLHWFDDLIRSTGGDVGIGLGNFPSPWLGNLYLNEVDQALLSRHPGIDYERYCDDMLIFSDDKAVLRDAVDFVETFLRDRLKLTLSKKTIYPTSHGVDFVGYRHFPSGKILLRKSTAKRMKRRLKALPWELKHGIISAGSARSVLMSTKGWLQWANTHNLQVALKINELTEVVEKYAEIQGFR